MRYELQEFLGAGGMGQVYRAYDPQLHRDVALKVLRGPTDETRRRALREARAQARVAHPNVCQIFDTGEHDGKSFIAMQLVEGKPLPDVAGDLDLRQKALLVRQVAEAVQAAHNSGLVHRDLKPANVLVELPKDGAARPFVVDFGIARSGDGPQLTHTGDLPGTPAYLAPELLLGSGKADRRSDVYGLGAILYELLRGRPPYEGETSIEILAQVVQRPPASLRSKQPEQPDLPRDLCWIVDQAMSREPERRYGSARLMAEDLDRYLRGEPVLARPPGLGYRFGLWLARNRAVAALVLVSLLLGLAGAVRYTVDLRTERRLAEQARDEAEEVSTFLVDIFRSADPRQNQGQAPTVREVLDRASRRVEAELEPGSEVRIRLDSVLGDIYSELGDYETADEHATAARAAAEARWGKGHPKTVAYLDGLADLRHLQTRADEARALWRAALSIRREAGLDPFRPLIGLGALAAEESDFESSRRLLGQALEIGRRTEDRTAQTAALFELARAEREAGRLDRAEELFGEALESAADGDQLKHALILNNLGMLYHDRGKLNAALTSFESVVATRRRILGDVHPSVAGALSNLGRSARMAGRYTDAAEAYEEVLQIYDQTLEPDHYWVGILLNNLGRLHRDLGRYDLAREELNRSLAILQKAVGERQPRTHFTVFNLALVDLDQGRLGPAGEGLKATRAALAELLGVRHYHVANALEGVALWQLRSGDPEGARETLDEALGIHLEAQEGDDLRTQRCKLRLAEALSRLRGEGGAELRAERLAREAAESLERRQEQAAETDRVTAALLATGHGILATVSRDEATRRERAEEGLSLLERCCSDESVVEWLELRAQLLKLAGRSSEAEALRAELRRLGFADSGTARPGR